MTVTMIQCHLRVIIQPLCCLWTQIMSTRAHCYSSRILIRTDSSDSTYAEVFSCGPQSRNSVNMLYNAVIFCCFSICTKPGCHMYLITMQLRGPSVPPALGPCDLSPQNSYLKHAAVGPNHVAGVKLLINFCSFATVKTTPPS